MVVLLLLLFSYTAAGATLVQFRGFHGALQAAREGRAPAQQGSGTPPPHWTRRMEAGWARRRRRLEPSRL